MLKIIRCYVCMYVYYERRKKNIAFCRNDDIVISVDNTSDPCRYCNEFPNVDEIRGNNSDISCMYYICLYIKH